MAKCEICGKGPIGGTTVYRQNEKGQVGIWRCQEHNAQPVDDDVKAIVDAIEAARKEADRG